MIINSIERRSNMTTYNVINLADVNEHNYHNYDTKYTLLIDNQLDQHQFINELINYLYNQHLNSHQTQINFQELVAEYSEASQEINKLCKRLMPTFIQYSNMNDLKQRQILSTTISNKYNHQLRTLWLKMNQTEIPFYFGFKSFYHRIHWHLIEPMANYLEKVDQEVNQYLQQESSVNHLVLQRYAVDSFDFQDAINNINLDHKWLINFISYYNHNFKINVQPKQIKIIKTHFNHDVFITYPQNLSQATNLDHPQFDVELDDDWY